MPNLEKQLKHLQRTMHTHPIPERKFMKRINMWYELFKEPPLDAINEFKDHHAGLWIKPWYAMNKKKPPLPVFLGMLDAMARMYDEWDKAFKKGKQAYDLQLWLYDEHMMDSQLVCAAVEKQGEQRTNYFHPCPEQYDFQSYKYLKCAAFDPQDFEWTTYEVRDYLYEKLDELNPKKIKKLLKNNWHEDVYKPGTEDEQRMFWQIYDFVWVGRKFSKQETVNNNLK